MFYQAEALLFPPSLQVYPSMQPFSSFNRQKDYGLPPNSHCELQSAQGAA
jgi:hypothetical protein